MEESKDVVLKLLNFDMNTNKHIIEKRGSLVILKSS